MKYFESVRLFLFETRDFLWFRTFLFWFCFIALLSALGVSEFFIYGSVFFVSFGVFLAYVILSIVMMIFQKKGWLQALFRWKYSQYGFFIFLGFDFFSLIFFLVSFLFEIGRNVLGQMLFFTIIPEITGLLSFEFFAHIFFVSSGADFLDSLGGLFIENPLFMALFGTLFSSVGFIVGLLLISYILGFILFLFQKIWHKIFMNTPS